MRCIFCKIDASQSRSVEHIVPESLGNKRHTLPPGVVCDRCNNYFANKVERPFLELSAVRLLRFHQAIPNKRGLIPEATGVLSPGFPVTVIKHLKGPLVGTVLAPPEALAHLLSQEKGTITFPSADAVGPWPGLSRFLAKVALEVMAERLVQYPAGLDYLVSEVQLDPIREHARFGRNSNWPVHIRRIYDENRRWVDESGSDVQTVYEYDFLVTDAGEWYFAIAIFGLELTINIGGPTIHGYLQWLNDHNEISPLSVTSNHLPPFA